MKRFIYYIIANDEKTKIVSVDTYLNQEVIIRERPEFSIIFQKSIILTQECPVNAVEISKGEFLNRLLQ